MIIPRKQINDNEDVTINSISNFTRKVSEVNKIHLENFKALRCSDWGQLCLVFEGRVDHPLHGVVVNNFLDLSPPYAILLFHLRFVDPGPVS